MKDVQITADGELVCPHCGTKQQFSYRRTATGKVLAGVTVGVGVLALPKRLQCLGCQEYLRSRPQPVPAGTSAVTVERGGEDAFTLPAGDVQVLILDCEWTGAARITMLKAARPGLRDHAYERMAEQLRKGEPTPVAAVTEDAALILARRLIENGFTVGLLDPEAPDV